MMLSGLGRAMIGRGIAILLMVLAGALAPAVLSLSRAEHHSQSLSPELDPGVYSVYSAALALHEPTAERVLAVTGPLETDGLELWSPGNGQQATADHGRMNALIPAKETLADVERVGTGQTRIEPRLPAPFAAIALTIVPTERPLVCVLGAWNPICPQAVRLSRVAFNTDLAEALVAIGSYGTTLPVPSNVLFLRKRGPGWVVASRAAWM